MEFRWAEGPPARRLALAPELLRSDVEVIVTHAAAPTLAANQATNRIPIAITDVGDAIAN